jgi:MFS family permease
VIAPGRPASRRTGTFRSLHVLDFRRLWTGSLLQSLGRWVQSATIPYLVYQQTHSGAWLGAAGAAMFLPGMVTTGVGGVLADRVRRARLIVVLQMLMCANAAGIGMCWVADLHPSALLLVFVAVDGSLFGLNVPVRQSVVNDLVPRDDLYSAIALTSAQFNIGRATGPAIAGILLTTAGAATALWVVVVLHAAAVVCGLRLVIPSAAHTGTTAGGSVLAGFREAWDHRGVRTATLLAAFNALVASSTFSLLPVIAARVYGTDGFGYGVLAAAYGGGALGAALITAGRLGSVATATVVRRTGPMYSLALLALAVVAWYPLGMAVLVLNGACFQVSQVAVTASVQRQAPDNARGRVLGAYFTLLALSLAAGSFLLGAATDRIGVVGAVLVCAAVYAAGTVVINSSRQLLAALGAAVERAEPIAASAEAAPAAV